MKNILINLPFAPLWEELGWREFLLTRLQSTKGAFAASLMVGAFWGPWHAPLQASAYRAYPNVNAFLAFLLFCIMMALSVILAWLYNKSSGNLFPCILFHSVFNNTSSFLIDAMVQRDGLKPMIWAAATVLTGALVLLARAGGDLARSANTMTATVD